jgi:hypothetical protein
MKLLNKAKEILEAGLKRDDITNSGIKEVYDQVCSYIEQGKKVLIDQ